MFPAPSGSASHMVSGVSLPSAMVSGPSGEGQAGWTEPMRCIPSSPDHVEELRGSGLTLALPLLPSVSDPQNEA